MYARTIVYHDLDDVKKSVVWHFQLTTGQIAEMTMRHGEQLWESFANLADPNKIDGDRLVDAFRLLLSNSVGQREGDRFKQSQDITDEFMQTGAYGEFLVELLSDPAAATDFFKAIVPKSLARKMEASDVDKSYTFDELIAMDSEEFDRVAGIDPRKWTRLQLQAAMKRQAMETAA